jgi:hypothetical protein
MQASPDAEKGALSKVLSPVKWRKAFSDALTNKECTRKQPSLPLVTTIALAVLATTLFVFVAMP